MVEKLQYGSWLCVPDRQPRAIPQRRTWVEYFDQGSSSSAPHQAGHSLENSPAFSTPPPPGTSTVNDSGAATPPVDNNLPPAPPEQPAAPPPVIPVPADNLNTTNTGTGLVTKVSSNAIDAAAARGQSATGTGLAVEVVSNDIAAAAAGGHSATDDIAAVESLKQPVVDTLPRQQTVSAPLPKASTAPLAT
ncbi:hypothetical protein V6N11_035738 [Hibiscus sabdariffa]|uniref:Uncharacterized protein n=1 Tax=Hibiscus sabdariffa TaxID=183260 RepID=A0ABR2R8C5_9ROSI